MWRRRAPTARRTPSSWESDATHSRMTANVPKVASVRMTHPSIPNIFPNHRNGPASAASSRVSLTWPSGASLGPTVSRRSRSTAAIMPGSPGARTSRSSDRAGCCNALR